MVWSKKFSIVILRGSMFPVMCKAFSKTNRVLQLTALYLSVRLKISFILLYFFEHVRIMKGPWWKFRKHLAGQPNFRQGYILATPYVQSTLVFATPYIRLEITVTFKCTYLIEMAIILEKELTIQRLLKNYVQLHIKMFAQHAQAKVIYFYCVFPSFF